MSTCPEHFSQGFDDFYQRFSVRISNNVGILNHHGIMSGQQGCTSVYFFLKQQRHKEPNSIEINEKSEYLQCLQKHTI